MKNCMEFWYARVILSCYSLKLYWLATLRSEIQKLYTIESLYLIGLEKCGDTFGGTKVTYYNMWHHKTKNTLSNMNDVMQEWKNVLAFCEKKMVMWCKSEKMFWLFAINNRTALWCKTHHTEKWTTLKNR